MAFVARKVLFVNYEVVIGVELPEPTVENVKVLVGEKISDSVYVLFFIKSDKGCNQITSI